MWLFFLGKSKKSATFAAPKRKFFRSYWTWEFRTDRNVNTKNVEKWQKKSLVL